MVLMWLANACASIQSDSIPGPPRSFTFKALPHFPLVKFIQRATLGSCSVVKHSPLAVSTAVYKCGRSPKAQCLELKWARGSDETEEQKTAEKPLQFKYSGIRTSLKYLCSKWDDPAVTFSEAVTGKGRSRQASSRPASRESLESDQVSVVELQAVQVEKGRQEEDHAEVNFVHVDAPRKKKRKDTLVDVPGREEGILEVVSL
ncbi:hypothetical protein H920_08582 [Fukomys damarensis]|uniref:Uncharacterized protein n=1 Tax=Fukomys damarensis TaxID=885580 RepID=A0A091DCV8_FUKDA|nr:hypothetical protein H920_08582 [Fukomys damarensis]